MVANNNEKIKEEYKTIQSFSESLNKTFVVSKANEKLNRYTNISPFDFNRVVLDDEFESDYINASYINVSQFEGKQFEDFNRRERGRELTNLPLSIYFKSFASK